MKSTKYFQFIWRLLLVMILIHGIFNNAIPVQAATVVASDSFESGDYTGGSGWTGNWIEDGDTGGATGDDIQIVTDDGDYVLQLQGYDNGVYRVADTSAGTIATLSFEYRRGYLNSATDSIRIQMATDGGAGSWTEIGRIDGSVTQTDSTYQSALYDISAYIGTATAVRFYSQDAEDGDILYIDNVEISLVDAPDLELTIRDSGDPLPLGTTFDYYLTVRNLGTTATGVVVSDTLPTGLTYLTSSASQGGCSQSAGTVTCDLGNLDYLESANIQITLAAPSTGVYNNSASVTLNETDDDASNNSASESTTVANAPADTCYTIADNGDILVTVDLSGPSSSAAPNGLGVSNVEANAYWAGTGILYVANDEVLGTVDTDTGIFTAIGAAGTGDGVQGSVTFNDLDSLTFDPFTGILYAVERQSTDGVDDLLLQIDPLTGLHIPDAFGAGVDYVEVTTVSAADGLNDVDDVAISTVDGTMYAVQNNSGTIDRLISIDKSTGATDDIARFTDGTANVNDMEGLGYDINGVFYGSTGNASTPDTNNDYYWEIDPSTAVSTQLTDLSAHGGDYEAADCLVGDVNTIAGTVFRDLFGDGTMDGSDTGTSGVTVRLYRDANNDGLVDAGDALLATTDTFSNFENGNYFFTVAAVGNFVLEIDTGDLPAGHSLTTDNVEAVSFSGTGNIETGNDFGHHAAVDIGDRVWLDLDGDGVQDAGEPGLSGVTVELDNGSCTLGSDCPTDTTDADGNYHFTNLPDGAYTILVQASTLPADVSQTGDPDDSLDGQHTLSAFAPGSYLDVDFGYQGSGSIGDYIWNDMDGDGVRDAAESGISGVTVSLYDATGTILLASTTTDANGEYTFSGLTYDDYIVQVTSPGGAQTGDPDSACPGAGCDHTTGVTINSTTPDVHSANFGYQFDALAISKISSAGGTVNPGETITYTITVRNNTTNQHTGIAIIDNVPVGTQYVDSSSQVRGYLLTAINNIYADQFDAIAYNNNTNPPGNQTWSGNWIDSDDGLPNGGAVQVLADGTNQYVLRPGDNPTGNNNTTNGTVNRLVGDLSACTSITLSYDYRRVSMESGDHLYLDLSADGGSNWSSNVGDITNGNDGAYLSSGSIDVYSYRSNLAIRFRSAYGGNGGNSNDRVFIDNVVVTCGINSLNPVTQAAHAPSDLVVSTDNFALDPGQSMTVTFQVTVDNPIAAGIGSIDNTASVVSAEQTTPQYASTTDALPLTNIGNYVWYDDDNDGLQGGTNDIDMFGITVNLYDPGPDGNIGGGDDVLVDTTTTASDGSYAFTNIPADSYYLDFDLPTGYSFTTQNAGGDDTVNSDVDASGQTAVFTLTSGETNNDLDAGLANSNLDYGDLPNSYSRTVFGHDGPRHFISTLRLGPDVDADPDGQESSTAQGDSGDDGVFRDMNDHWTNGATVDLQLNLEGSTASGLADAGVWIDWNGDGVFAAGEFFAFSGLTVGGSNTVQITVPDAATYDVGDIVNVRVRVFDPANLPGGSLDGNDYTGLATNGEVEDYQWDFNSPNAVSLAGFSANANGFPVWIIALAAALLVGAGAFLLRMRKQTAAIRIRRDDR